MDTMIIIAKLFVAFVSNTYVPDYLANKSITFVYYNKHHCLLCRITGWSRKTQTESI